MRHALLTGLLALTACAGPRALDGELAADDRAELLRVREEVWRSWFAGDEARLDGLLTDDFLAIDPEGGVIPGKRYQIDQATGFARSGGRLVSLAFPQTEIQVLGDVAVIYTTFELELDTPDGRAPMTGRATEIFRRQGRTWVHPGWHMDTR